MVCDQVTSDIDVHPAPGAASLAADNRFDPVDDMDRCADMDALIQIDHMLVEHPKTSA